MQKTRFISFITAAVMIITALAGLAAVTSLAEDTETVYNFSELTEAAYKKTGVDVFSGALNISGTEDAKPAAKSATITSPLGNAINVTSVLMTKQLAVKIPLKAGETVVVYYCFSDTNFNAKSLNMDVKNSAGTVLKTETNDENKGGFKPYEISYTAETEGDYTIVETGGDKVRTVVFAVVVTTADYNSGSTTPTTTTNPSATTTPSATAAVATDAPTQTPIATVDPNAEPEVTITREQGWLESAYVTWTNPVAVDKYNVYIKPENGSYTKIDDELVRYYGSYYRADALGLAAGKYQIKVAPVIAGVEKGAKESSVVTVESYIREGFAFDSHSSHYNAAGVGAYKNDGTLKDGAKVLYITDANKDTVKFDVVTDASKGTTTTCTGLAEILSAREKNKAEDTPLAIRMIGQVESPAGKNSLGYMQIKSTSNVTFEGVGEDATTYHWSFLVREANNVEIRNLAVMEFYDDGISLDTNNYNCWVHNCDIFYGQNRGGDQKKGDGSLDVKSGSDYCSFSYNHFWDSGKTSLCGMKTDNNQGYHMTYYGNWFDHSDSRHPRVRGDQVHIYNNYYDGNSKYGAGACTGSSVYIEKNVFRNTVHPVLISQQGTDVAGGAVGTFSGEDGGIIKMYDNAIYGGIDVVYASESNTDNFDAYLATTRDETVPAAYAAKKGGTTYSNFDTASTMYSYTPLDTNKVVDAVKKYAGRTENGDFTHTFDDSVDDALYDRDTVLGDALQDYKTTLKTEYTLSAAYPATEGTQPEARATAEPFDSETQPTPKPNTGEGGSTGGGSSDTNTTTDMWRASDTAKNVTADTVLKESWLTLVGNGVEYKSTNKSIGGVSLTGKVNAPSGQTAPTLAEKGQNGATLKFTPDKDGTIGVYYKLNNNKTFYIIDSEGTEINSHENATGATEYTYTSATVEAGKTYYAFGGGTNAEYWAADYTTESEYSDSGDDDGPSESPSPSSSPEATTEPEAKPEIQEPNFKASVSVKNIDKMPGEKGVIVAAQYDGTRLENVQIYNVTASNNEAQLSNDFVTGSTVTVMLWDDIKTMTPYDKKTYNLRFGPGSAGDE